MVLGMMMPEMVASQTFTNGVYFEKGKTVEIDKSIHQITPTNSSEILYFSNGLTIKVDTNTDFSINSFYQEIINTNIFPEKLKVKSHNFAATLIKGNIIVTYLGGDENSSCIISTPLTDHELSKGTFVFQADENFVSVLTLDGSLKTTGDRNVYTTPKGYALIAKPNTIGILDSKVTIMTDNRIKTSVINNLIIQSQDVINPKDSVMFIKIDGKIIGIVIN